MSSSGEEEEFNGALDEEDDENDDGEEEGEVREDDDDDSDDEPLSSLVHSNETQRKKRDASKISKSYADDDDDDDDSDNSADDVPLSSLVKKGSPTKKTVAAKKNGTKGKVVKKTTPTKNEKSTTKSKKSSSSNGNSNNNTTTTSNGSSRKTFDSASAAFYGTECDKGLLIQRLLCRWWYAYEWPDPSCILKKPPTHYDPLDGFPGVYVRTTGGTKIGHLKDLRNQDDCPSFRTFAKKSCSELKQLLITALTEQQKRLVQVEGTGTTTEKEIKTLLQWTNRVNVDKAEREVTKVMKAHKLQLLS
jgi:hypothetical protein